MTLEIQVLARDRHKTGSVKSTNGIPTLFLTTGSPMIINNNINRDGTIAVINDQTRNQFVKSNSLNFPPHKT